MLIVKENRTVSYKRIHAILSLKPNGTWNFILVSQKIITNAHSPSASVKNTLVFGWVANTQDQYYTSHSYHKLCRPDRNLVAWSLNTDRASSLWCAPPVNLLPGRLTRKLWSEWLTHGIFGVPVPFLGARFAIQKWAKSQLIMPIYLSLDLAYLYELAQQRANCNLGPPPSIYLFIMFTL